MAKNKSAPPSLSKRKQAAQQKQQRLGQILMGIGGLLLLGFIALAVWPLLKPAHTNLKPQVTGAAALRSDKEQIDLGDVHLGNTVSAAFQLTNVGDQPLTFTQAPYIEVKAGC